MKHSSRWAPFTWFILLSFQPACSFKLLEGEGEVVPDALSPILCGDLTCDPHAICLDGPSRCICPQGFTGDGFQCADIDECATANGGCAASCVNRDGNYTCHAPRQCEDLRAVVPGWNGGTATLYLNGEADKPWTVHCTTADLEYLTLPRTNYSMYKA